MHVGKYTSPMDGPWVSANLVTFASLKYDLKTPKPRNIQRPQRFWRFQARIKTAIKEHLLLKGIET